LSLPLFIRLSVCPFACLPACLPYALTGKASVSALFQHDSEDSPPDGIFIKLFFFVAEPK
jgi:hypothetical protein